jgi:hypothetical protein
VTLPENQRGPCLKRFGDLSYRKSGKVGLSAQAVGGLLKQARQFLKKACKLFGIE